MAKLGKINSVGKVRYKEKKLGRKWAKGISKTGISEPKSRYRRKGSKR